MLDPHRPRAVLACARRLAVHLGPPASAVLAAASRADAQSVIPPQISSFMCQNYAAISAIAPVVLLVVLAAGFLGWIALGKAVKTSVPDIWLVRSQAGAVVMVIIAITVINLKGIIATFGLQTACQ